MNISFGSKSEEKVIEHSNNPEVPDFPITDNFGKRKIICNVWSTHAGRDVIVASKKVKFGTKYFVVKLAGRKHRFKVVYDPKIGALKQGKKFFIYDVHFDNALGALAFHEYKEKVDSRHADTMALDDSVKFFIDKGGLNFMWLIVAMLGIVVLAGILAYVVMQYMQYSQIAQYLQKQVDQDTNTIATLNAQIKNGGQPCTAIINGVCQH